MRYRGLGTCWVLAIGLLAGPASDRLRAEPWDLSGNTFPTIPAPIGTFQHDGSGFYTALEFVALNQPRTIGHQDIAFRGFVDSAGLLTGVAGNRLGSFEPALSTGALGRTQWSPGSRLTVGYRLENGWNFSLSWLHLFDTASTGGAGTQGPNFANPGQFLENTFLFSPVFNFSPMFTGPVARTTDANGNIAFGALNGIWNGASEMSIKYTQRFDNWDLLAKIPVFESENARSRFIAGARFSWLWERFLWYTATYGIDVVNIAQGQPPSLIGSPEWSARYVNTLSQRMYGPVVGAEHDVYLGSGFSVGCEVTGGVLANIIKERAKYIRGDEATQAKRSWSELDFVPNVNGAVNISWQPVDGMTLRLGYNAMNYFNTRYLESPVGFDVGAIDPAYGRKAIRVIHGLNVGLSFVW
jgi:Legionella pneumophila major outer membrane protein precursor